MYSKLVILETAISDEHGASHYGLLSIFRKFSSYPLHVILGRDGDDFRNPKTKQTSSVDLSVGCNVSAPVVPHRDNCSITPKNKNNKYCCIDESKKGIWF